MRKYSFERAAGASGTEQIAIFQKNRSFHLVPKLLCLLLAFVFWLTVVGVRRTESDKPDPASSDTASVTAVWNNL